MSFTASSITPPTLNQPPSPCSAADLAGADVAALLKRLGNSDYYCTELIAATLIPQASTSLVGQLLKLAQNSAKPLARRNALRVLGRFAERPAGEPAHDLVIRSSPAGVRDLDGINAGPALAGQLTHETDEDSLHEILWILDAYFYPLFNIQGYLESASANTSNSDRLRFRCISAYARLMYARDKLNPHELAFLNASLRSDDFWVRAEAAFIFEQLRPEQVTKAEREYIYQALKQAWQTEQLLTPRQYMARAIDHFNGNSILSSQLRGECETQWLPNTLVHHDISVRSALPDVEALRFIKLMENERQAFFDLLGHEFTTPVANDPNDKITLMLFASKANYIEYMNAFVGYGAQAGGLYIERDGKLYTFLRTRAESTFTVEQLIQHEFGHYLQGRYVYQHLWSDAGYHTEPRGWADEGLAEYLGGLQFDANGRCCGTNRPEHVNSICGCADLCDLNGLICRREGYDQPGTFDYPNAWSFMHYLCTHRLDVARRLFRAMRNGQYRDEAFDAVAGVPLAQLQHEWHNTMTNWRNGGAVETMMPPTDSPSIITSIIEGLFRPRKPLNPDRLPSSDASTRIV